MSELSSLVAKISISRENLEQFMEAAPATFEKQTGWREWWNGLKMYSKSELSLQQLKPFRNATNHDIITDWQQYKPSMTYVEYNEDIQTWYFSIMQFSENYFEMIPMLGFLRSLEAYKNPDDSDFVMVYPFFWGDNTLQAYIRFLDNKSYFEKKPDVLQQRWATHYLEQRWKILEQTNQNSID